MEDCNNSDNPMPSCSMQTVVTNHQSEQRTFPWELTSLTDVINFPACILVTLIPVQLLNFLLFYGKRHIPGQIRFVKFKTTLTILLVILTSWKTGGFTQHVFDFAEKISLGELCSISIPTRSQVVPYMVVLLITMLEKIACLNMRLPLLLFWSASFSSLSIHLYEDIQDVGSSGLGLCEMFFVDFVIISIVFVQCILLCLRYRQRELDDERLRQDETWVHPQEKSSWFGDFILQWTQEFVKTASKRTLLESDVFDLAQRDQCRFVSAEFEQNLKIEEEKNKEFDSKNPKEVGKVKGIKSGKAPTSQSQQTSKKRISLVKILIKTFGVKFFAFQFTGCLTELVEFAKPVLMGAFMNHIRNRDKEHWSLGFSYILGIFLINAFRHVFFRRLWAATNRHFKQIRNSVSISVFKKSLTVRNECTKDLTTGEIVNLISDDIDKVYEAVEELSRVLSAPMVIGIAMYLLYNLVGYSVFVGLIIMVLLIPLNKQIGKSIDNFYKEKDKTKHRRTKFMNEIINGMKLLKLYAWEPPFMQKVKDIRAKEEHFNNIISLFRAGMEGMFRAVPFLVRISSFGVYLLVGGQLDPVTGFVTIHLFHILNDPVTDLAILVPQYLEAAVALKRIESFLNGDDIPSDIVKKNSKTKSAISVSEGEFTWERNRKTSTLKNINIDLPKGKLIAVVGVIGSGKSSFLSAILGEMEKIKGVVEVEGTVAYVPQEAWILNTTLKENVLFGSPLEADWYRGVMEACALSQDISTMKAGDKTEIGEKGINLSGGQKQRVSLARAIYQDADVYLLDDPLSAVDAHVGKHIFNEVIGDAGLLKGKTRVLVTHGVHWLPHVDFIVVMKDGEIAESGTYQNLMAGEGTFSQVVKDVQRNVSERSRTEMFRNKKRKSSNSVSSAGKRKSESQEISDSEIMESSDIGDESIDDDGDDDSCGGDDGDDGSGDESNDDSSSDEGDSDESFEESDDEKGVLIKDEDLEQGKINKEIYMEYFKAIGLKRVAFFIFLHVITGLFDACSMRLVTQWTDDPVLEENSTLSLEERDKLNWSYFRWYTTAGTFEVICAFLFVLVISRGTFNASTRLHNKLLYRIMRCPMSFFDTTPSSRIFTRFSKDVARVDGLGRSLQELIMNLFDIFIFLGMIVFYCPAVSYYIIALSIAYYTLYKFHIGSIRQLKRFMSKYKPPVLSHFTETLNGLASIRAYKCQGRFVSKMENHIDEFTKFDLMEMWCHLVLTLRSGLLYHLVAFFAGVVCLFDTSLTAGMVGLIALYTEDSSESMDEFCWNLTHTESEFTSLEKLIEYSNKPSEPDWEIGETKPSSDWPDKGRVTFKDYAVRYRDGLDLVVKGVNCEILPGEKVGIAGRTGAGKTSLTLSLFRIMEAAEGGISVDDTNISELGLHNLRSRINILPQTPFIFSGTIKLNLDPFGESSDESLWHALKCSHLSSFVNHLPKKLDFECGEGGKNLSAGQRQLLCLARALLRKTKVLILDEATAAVDMETDELIQKTIRSEFTDCTVLTVAHRINTILDYDKILIMDQGEIKEFDTPNHLLSDQKSIFYSMAKDARLIQ